ncbi:hypothetical protein HYQ44_000598 [Verticillium longisporum]|nr:hypothetical protein HYQ44_000598 [Verticillium longisporum]
MSQTSLLDFSRCLKSDQQSNIPRIDGGIGDKKSTVHYDADFSTALGRNLDPVRAAASDSTFAEPLAVEPSTTSSHTNMVGDC